MDPYNNNITPIISENISDSKVNVTTQFNNSQEIQEKLNSISNSNSTIRRSLSIRRDKRLSVDLSHINSLGRNPTLYLKSAFIPYSIDNDSSSFNYDVVNPNEDTLLLSDSEGNGITNDSQSFPTTNGIHKSSISRDPSFAIKKRTLKAYIPNYRASVDAVTNPLNIEYSSNSENESSNNYAPNYNTIPKKFKNSVSLSKSYSDSPKTNYSISRLASFNSSSEDDIYNFTSSSSDKSPQSKKGQHFNPNKLKNITSHNFIKTESEPLKIINKSPFQLDKGKYINSSIPLESDEEEHFMSLLSRQKTWIIKSADIKSSYNNKINTDNQNNVLPTLKTASDNNPDLDVNLNQKKFCLYPSHSSRSSLDSLTSSPSSRSSLNYLPSSPPPPFLSQKTQSPLNSPIKQCTPSSQSSYSSLKHIESIKTTSNLSHDDLEPIQPSPNLTRGDLEPIRKSSSLPRNDFESNAQSSTISDNELNAIDKTSNISRIEFEPIDHTYYSEGFKQHGLNSDPKPSSAPALQINSSLYVEKLLVPPRISSPRSVNPIHVYPPKSSLPEIPQSSITTPHHLQLSVQSELPNVHSSPIPEASHLLLPLKPTSPLPEIPKSPLTEIPKSPLPEIPKSPLPEIPKSPLPEIPKSPLPQIPKSPLPQIPKSPLPQILKSPMPSLYSSTLESLHLPPPDIPIPQKLDITRDQNPELSLDKKVLGSVENSVLTNYDVNDPTSLDAKDPLQSSIIQNGLPNSVSKTTKLDSLHTSESIIHSSTDCELSTPILDSIEHAPKLPPRICQSTVRDNHNITSATKPMNYYTELSKPVLINGILDSKDGIQSTSPLFSKFQSERDPNKFNSPRPYKKPLPNIPEKVFKSLSPDLIRVLPHSNKSTNIELTKNVLNQKLQFPDNQPNPDCEYNPAEMISHIHKLDSTPKRPLPKVPTPIISGTRRPLPKPPLTKKKISEDIINTSQVTPSLNTLNTGILEQENFIPNSIIDKAESEFQKTSSFPENSYNDALADIEAPRVSRIVKSKSLQINKIPPPIPTAPKPKINPIWLENLSRDFPEWTNSLNSDHISSLNSTSVNRLNSINEPTDLVLNKNHEKNSSAPINLSNPNKSKNGKLFGPRKLETANNISSLPQKSSSYSYPKFPERLPLENFLSSQSPPLLSRASTDNTIDLGTFYSDGSKKSSISSRFKISNIIPDIPSFIKNSSTRSNPQQIKEHTNPIQNNDVSNTKSCRIKKEISSTDKTSSNPDTISDLGNSLYTKSLHVSDVNSSDAVKPTDHVEIENASTEMSEKTNISNNGQSNLLSTLHNTDAINDKHNSKSFNSHFKENSIADLIKSRSGSESLVNASHTTSIFTSNLDNSLEPTLSNDEKDNAHQKPISLKEELHTNISPRNANYNIGKSENENESFYKLINTFPNSKNFKSHTSTESDTDDSDNLSTSSFENKANTSFSRQNFESPICSVETRDIQENPNINLSVDKMKNYNSSNSELDTNHQETLNMNENGSCDKCATGACEDHTIRTGIDLQESSESSIDSQHPELDSKSTKEINRIKKRREAIMELYHTEASYARDIGIIIEAFYHPIEALCESTITDLIFGNIQNIATTSVSICSALENVLEPVKIFHNLNSLQDLYFSSQSTVSKENHGNSKKRVIVFHQKKSFSNQDRRSLINPVGKNKHPAYSGNYKPVRFTPSICVDSIDKNILNELKTTETMPQLTKDRYKNIGTFSNDSKASVSSTLFSPGYKNKSKSSTFVDKISDDCVEKPLYRYKNTSFIQSNLRDKREVPDMNIPSNSNEENSKESKIARFTLTEETINSLELELEEYSASSSKKNEAIGIDTSLSPEKKHAPINKLSSRYSFDKHYLKDREGHKRNVSAGGLKKVNSEKIKAADSELVKSPSVQDIEKANNDAISLDIFDSINLGSSLMELTSGLLENYTKYSANYRKAAAFLKDLNKFGNMQNKLQSPSSPKLSVQLIDTIAQCERNPKTRKLDLQSFLFLPIQRLTRYPLLIRAILKYTDPSSDDHTELSSVILEFDRIISEVDSKSDDIATDEKIDAVKKLLSNPQFSFLPDLSGETLELGKRKLIFEGKLSKLYTTKSLYGFLFNDMILITLIDKHGKSCEHSIYLPPMSLCDLVVRKPSSDSSTFFYQGESFELYNVVTKKSIVLKAPSKKLASEWIEHLSSSTKIAYDAVYQKISEGIHVGKRTTIYAPEIRDNLIRYHKF
ncbi:Intersectin-2 [Smittium culicis]|uniref:Intersectin-2 n=1 Tax=Smittium culicis TaxID=133412 RepID=A0A1R1XBQ5_9FUNG|nr:Intersectin-2 [Smittium culicis]